jgi:hypothetical protein
MIELIDKDSGNRIGTVTEEQLGKLVELLEEEFEEDADYYMDEATLAYLEEDGLDAELVTLLRRALGEREGMDVQWVRR